MTCRPALAEGRRPRGEGGRARKSRSRDGGRGYARRGSRTTGTVSGANVAWSSRCTKNAHLVAPTFTSVRVGASAGCRYCGRITPRGRRRAAGQARAEADMRAAGFEPLEPYPGARARWPCRHVVCGRTVHPRLFGIRAGKGGCRACAGRAPVDQRTAEAEMRAIGMEPLEPFPGRVRDRWMCRCTTCAPHRRAHPQQHPPRAGRVLRLRPPRRRRPPRGLRAHRPYGSGRPAPGAPVDVT
ncbi:hypothetical protein SRIMM317S_06863 [Streptomyces rimosus subsp. rimosus]